MRRIVKLIDHGSIRLFLFVLVMLTPFTAWAQTNYGLFIGDYENYYPNTNQVGVKVTSANASNITHTCIKSGTVSFDLESRTLTLNNATIDGSIYSYGALTINLIGDNYVTATDSSAIVGEISSAAQTLTIKGTGRLMAKGTTAYVTDGFDAPTYQEGQSLLLWAGYDADNIFTALYGTQLFSGGNGTSADNSYLIGSTTDLKNLSIYFEEKLLTSSCFYKLSDDINCSNLTGFKPIGTSGNPFIGTFNGSKGDNSGNYYKISNLTYNAAGESDYAGLFYVIGSKNNPGSVSNLILENCTFQKGTENNGAIAGMLSNGSIENCTVTSCEITSEDSWPSCGGIVGSLYGGSITNCTVNGSTITSTSVTNSQAGGIVGFITGTATVSGCQVTGTAGKPTTITGSVSSEGDTGNNCSGGIVGVCSDGVISISNNKVLGNTTISSTDMHSTNTCAGAIVGDKGSASLAGNTYEYTVTTSTKNGEDDAVEKKDYEQRALGQPVIEDDETKYDIVDGAMLTGLHSLTLQGLGDNCAFEGDEGYVPLADYENRVFYFLPGLTTTIYLYPNDIYTTSVALNYAETQGADPTPHTLNRNPEEDGYVYSFEMPDAEATFNVTLTSKPSIWIGSVEVNEDGTFPDYGETALFDAETSTLTLNGISYSGEITSGLDELTIKVTGTNNQIGKIVSLNPAATLTFEKASAEAAASLTLSTAQMTKASAVISGFANVNWGDMYLSSSTPYQYDTTNKLLVNPTAEETEELTSATITSETAYPLWVGGTQVTGSSVLSDNINGVYDGDDYGITFTAGETNLLQLKRVGIHISENHKPAIVSGLDNLTIQLEDRNQIYFNGDYACYMVASAKENATLTFKASGDDALMTANIGDSQYIGSPANGFQTVSYDNNLVYIAYGTSTQSIKKLDAPTVSLSDGYLMLSSNESTGNNLEGLVIKYSVDYADATTDITDATYAEGTSPAISSPCTITAYAEYNGKTGIEATAKYFGFTEPMQVVYAGTAVELPALPAIVPAIADGDDVTYEIGSEPEGTAVTYDQQTEKYMVAGYGTAVLGINLMQGDNTPYNVLNVVAQLTVNVIPTAPTIELAEGEHLSSETVSITSTITGAVIKYKWNDGTAQTYTEAIPVENGTLTAWVEVNPEGTTIVSSEEVTAEYTVKTDIATLYVAPIEDIAYNGSAVTLTIVVKATEDAEASLVSGTDYTVSYKQGETAVAATDLINVATYTVVISGNGSYGGTKEIPFNITQAENSLTTTPAAVTELTYTGEAKDLITAGVAKFGDVQYKLGANGTYSTTIPTATDANTTGYTVYYKVEGTDNYAGIAEASIVVAIAKANVTITQAPTANTLTYTGSAQALAEAGTVSAGTMVYSKTINGTFTAAIPEETNAGTYTVYYKVDGNDNYNGIDASETNKVSVTINPATITGVTLLLEEPLVYNGEPQTVEIATVTAGTLVLTNDDTEFAKVFDISGNSATEKGTYTVTVAAKENSNFTGSATADFSIKYRTASLDLFKFESSQTFGTFYSPEENLELPETIKAYIISGVSGNSVTLTELNYIPMGVPVLVEKIEGTATRPEANPETTSNMLKYASGNEALDRSAGTLYVLYNGMFVRATNNTVAAQNVYLQVPVSTPNSARTLSIKGGDGTTAIESINRIESSDTDRWYDMQGRRIERPTKTGIYLNNGKKVVIK